MDGRKVLGGILILAGIILAFYGINELNTLSSKVLRFVGQKDTGAYTAIGGGIVAGIIGLVLLFPKRSS